MKRSPLVIIFVTVFVDLVGFGIILPLLPYYAETYGASSLAVGLLFTSYSLMQFVFTPVWGRLSDRYGRRPLILMSLAGSCIGFLIFGLARNLILLFLARVVAGIAGAIIPTTNAYIADITPPETRARHMGLVGAAFGLGFILGPAIGGLLAPFGYDKPAFLASAMAGVNLLFAYFRLPESLTPEIRFRTRSQRFDVHNLLLTLRHPYIGLLLGILFLATFAFSNMEATFALLNEHRYGLSARETGFLFTYVGFLLTIIQASLVGHLVRLLGERMCVVVGTFSMIFGLLYLPYASSVPVYCAFIAFLAFGSGVNNPSLHALLSRHSGIDEQGGVMGIAHSVSSLGRILGPMWGGFTFGSLGYEWPFLTGGLFMGVAFILSIYNLRKR